ncbi:hypothetical protein, partial [Escherichia coli]|uniref:hypothetical protein n=1 Tax=Escherichia coli TaxID=562 RepID=UPI001956B9CC
KINMLDSTDTPQSWDEVSKALQEIKSVVKPPSTLPPQPQLKPVLHKNVSFHTVEELDAKLASRPEPKPKLEFKKAGEKNITYKPKPEKAEAKEGGEKNVKAVLLPSPPIEEEEGGGEGKGKGG